MQRKLMKKHLEIFIVYFLQSIKIDNKNVLSQQKGEQFKED